MYICAVRAHGYACMISTYFLCICVNMCVFVRTCVRMHNDCKRVCVYASMYASVHVLIIYMLIRTYASLCRHVFTHVNMHTYMSIRTYVCMCMYVRSYVNIHTDIVIYE